MFAQQTPVHLQCDKIVSKLAYLRLWTQGQGGGVEGRGPPPPFRDFWFWTQLGGQRSTLIPSVLNTNAKLQPATPRPSLGASPLRPSSLCEGLAPRLRLVLVLIAILLNDTVVSHHTWCHWQMFGQVQEKTHLHHPSPVSPLILFEVKYLYYIIFFVNDDISIS